MNSDKEKTRKTRNKKAFLNELKDALREIKTSEKYAIETGLKFSEAFAIVKKNGVIKPVL